MRKQIAQTILRNQQHEIQTNRTSHKFLNLDPRNRVDHLRHARRLIRAGERTCIHLASFLISQEHRIVHIPIRHALTPLLRAIQTKFRILVSTISVQQFYGDPFVLQEIALEKPYANFIERVSV